MAPEGRGRRDAPNVWRGACTGIGQSDAICSGADISNLPDWHPSASSCWVNLSPDAMRTAADATTGDPIFPPSLQHLSPPPPPSYPQMHV